MPVDSPTPDVPVVVGKRTFLNRLCGGFSRARVRVLALGTIFLALGAYVSTLGVVREELCRDGLRWACGRLSCGQPILLDPVAGKLKATISNPTEYSANILNATLDVNAGSEPPLSIPLQTGTEGPALAETCIAGSSSISTIELKSRSATTVELRPMNPDCAGSSDSACDPSASNVATPRDCWLTLRLRDGLGSEYSLVTKFSCLGLVLKKCGNGQVDSPPATVHTVFPPQTPKTSGQDVVSLTAEQVRTDVRSYFQSGGTVVGERDIWTEAPQTCKPDANSQVCSVRVEVTTQDVSGLRHCTAHFAVYRYISRTWKLDDLTGAEKCAH